MQDQEFINRFVAIEEWQRRHEEQDALKFTAIQNSISALPTKEDIPEIIADALMKTGKSYYSGLLVAAGVVGALAIIFGGLKMFLSWLGIVIMRP